MEKVTELIQNTISTNKTFLNLRGLQLTSLPENMFESLSNLQLLDISYNNLTSLPEKIFDPLINLEYLYIRHNNLTTLPENIFASLTKLKVLHIFSNRLSSLPENIFVSLTSLEQLLLMYNELTNLPENIFASLTYLKELYLYNNELTSLPENIFAPLTNLKTLSIGNNKLTTLPSSILGCGRLTTLFIGGLELIPDIRIQRFIERMNNYNNHGIFTDTQNIHASSIQTSTKQSINTLFKDSFLCSKDDIIKECLTWDISCLPDLLSYLEDTDVHSTLLISFYDVFVKVFGRIMRHPNKLDIICRLDEELKESECKCFTGRLTRLINCLVGFYDDIVIGISESERISTIILSTLDGREMNDELKKICFDKLKDIDISDEEIKKWLL
jgi:Leucine-rich repeat (LRR) protein